MRSPCNNRNPSPPCPEGFTTKEGKPCCYKSPAKKASIKKPAAKKPAAKKTSAKRDSTGKSPCTTRNPAPPCAEGYTTKEGKPCCYKSPAKKKAPAKSPAKKVRKEKPATKKKTPAKVIPDKVKSPIRKKVEEIKSGETLQEYFARKPITEKEAEATRREIVNLFPADAPITDELLWKMFEAYDSRVFHNRIKDYLKDSLSTLTIRGNARLTNSAGRCAKGTNGCSYLMEFATKIFNQLDMKKNQYSGGLLCKSRIECLALTFEHELIHLLFAMGLAKPEDNHGKYFKELIGETFLHTETKHNLLDGNLGIDVDREKTKKDFSIGQIVNFPDKNDSLELGRIIKLGPSFAQLVNLSNKALVAVRYPFLLASK